MSVYTFSMQQLSILAPVVCSRVGRYMKAADIDGVYGVPKGGLVPAAVVAGLLQRELLDQPTSRCLVVDDIVDSGRTLEQIYKEFPSAAYAAFVNVDRVDQSLSAFRPAQISYGMELSEHDYEEIPWVEFAWDPRKSDGSTEHSPESNVQRVLQYLGEDITRDGLIDTPERYLRALKEMCAGYEQDPGAILSKRFQADSNEMIILRDIQFSSLCEHHVLPFSGVAHVSYIPRPEQGVVGLSKLARLVTCYAQRLQIQERMTQQIARALVQHVQPLGVGVIVEAAHGCAQCRGVRQPTARMITSALTGVFERPEVRNEFMTLVR